MYHECFAFSFSATLDIYCSEKIVNICIFFFFSRSFTFFYFQYSIVRTTRWTKSMWWMFVDRGKGIFKFWSVDFAEACVSNYFYIRVSTFSITGTKQENETFIWRTILRRYKSANNTNTLGSVYLLCSLFCTTATAHCFGLKN